MLSRHPSSRISPKQSILRVQVLKFFAYSGTLPVCAARDDHPKKATNVPAAFAKVHRQPVEKIRVRRPFPLQTEVVRRSHEARVEHRLPHAIDRDTSHERIVGSRHPPGQSKPVLRLAVRQRPEHRRDSRRHRLRLVGLVVLAAREHEGLARLGAILHHHGSRNRAFQLGQLGLGRGEIRLRLPVRRRNLAPPHGGKSRRLLFSQDVGRHDRSDQPMCERLIRRYRTEVVSGRPTRIDNLQNQTVGPGLQRYSRRALIRRRAPIHLLLCNFSPIDEQTESIIAPERQRQFAGVWRENDSPHVV